MNSVKQAPWQADALLLLVTALAAGGWIFSKEALAGMPPLLFIGTRFLLAGLILLGFAHHSAAGFAGFAGLDSSPGCSPDCL